MKNIIAYKRYIRILERRLAIEQSKLSKEPYGKKKKPNFSPPGWLVLNFDVRLPEELAKRLDTLRHKLTDPLPPEDHTGFEHYHYNELLCKAVGMLIEREEAIEEMKERANVDPIPR